MKYVVSFFVALMLFAQATYAQVERGEPQSLSPISTTPPIRKQAPDQQKMMRMPSGKPPQDKVQACQRMERNVLTKASNITNGVNTFLEKGDSIVNRVKDFYQTKLVADGKSLSNYDELVSNIETKKAQALEEVANLNIAASEFNCEQPPPGSSMTKFREEMKAVRRGLQEYKTAIKNLIVAVHRLSSNGEPVPTVSVEPTITPFVPAP